MYEDNLYLSTLYEYPRHPWRRPGPCLSGSSTRGRYQFRERVLSIRATEPTPMTSTAMPPGSSLALVGENGSGKPRSSSCYAPVRPEPRAICFEGLDLREWDEVLRERSAYISGLRALPVTGGENAASATSRTSKTSPLARRRRKGVAPRSSSTSCRGTRRSRQVVPGRSRALWRPVAEDSAVACVHAHRCRRWCR